MSKPTVATRPNTKLPEPPKRPKFRSLSNIRKAHHKIPYFISGEPELDPNLTEEESILRAIEDEDTVAVLLRPLKLRDYIQFEQQYGEGIDAFLYKIFHVIQVTTSNLSEDDPDKRQELVVENGVIKTPFGDLYGSLATNIATLCSFILSCGGQIVGFDGKEYETESITVDEIIDLLDPNAFFTLNQESDFNPFYEILNVSNLWNPDEVEADLEKAGEMTAEEVKTGANFHQPTEDENSPDEQQNLSESKSKLPATRRNSRK